MPSGCTLSAHHSLADRGEGVHRGSLASLNEFAAGLLGDLDPKRRVGRNELGGLHGRLHFRSLRTCPAGVEVSIVGLALAISMIVVMQENDGYNPDVNRENREMGHSQAEKAKSRERILAEAARQIRQHGLESVSVGTLMKSVGLTHGGFYGHFESREALLASALERALLEGEAKAGAQPLGDPPRFAAIVREYLSKTHRDARDSGCAVAALGADVARAEAGPREVMSDHVETFIDTMAAALGGDEERAIMAVSAMIGALTLSRVVTDPARSDSILRAVRSHLAELDLDRIA